MNRKNYKRLMRSLAKARLRKPHQNSELITADRALSQISELAPYYRQFSSGTDNPSLELSEHEYVDKVVNLLRDSRGAAEETGIMGVVEEFGEIIVEGMKYDDIPSIDKEALSRLGVIDSEAELLVAFMKTKHQSVFSRSSCSRKIFNDSVSGNVELSGCLDRIEELIREKHLQSDFSENKFQKESHTKRRWFKGLGKVAQGSALTLANAGLATSILVLPVEPATQTWGAIVSSITGVGTTLSGIGELRGE